jgi:hypothetical protein
MSTKDGIVSSAEQDGQDTDSVYDFLYYDARRVGSFLAQFDSSGHLQQITQTESVTKGGKPGLSLKVAGAVPLPGTLESPEASVTFGRDPSQKGSETQGRVYDPLWTNARAMLDYLDERGLIHRDLTRARLGQFVIASGKLSVLDTGWLPKLMKVQNVGDVAVGQSVENAKKLFQASPEYAKLNSGQRSQVEKTLTRTVSANARTAMEILPMFPATPQCTIKGDNLSVWTTLSPEGMVGTVSDLSLKHGTEIAGEWHLLGILDALPNPITPQIQIVNTGVPEHFGKAIKNFSNLARTLVGRAPEEYGVTALLLFRDVSIVR